MRTFDYSVTLTGPRKDNQDNIGFLSTSEYILACIADGVGGEEGGKLASSYCTGLFLNYGKDKSLFAEGAIAHRINEKLQELQKSVGVYPKMATTLTGCNIHEKTLRFIHTGDTRLYILRNNQLILLTKDQHLRKHGKTKTTVLTSAMGVKKEFSAISGEFTLENSDRVLLTTDGFHTKISDATVELISEKSETMLEFSLNLKEKIAAIQLDDNCSFLTFEYHD